jgi:hypothetical protein
LQDSILTNYATDAEKILHATFIGRYTGRDVLNFLTAKEPRLDGLDFLANNYIYVVKI